MTQNLKMIKVVPNDLCDALDAKLFSTLEQAMVYFKRGKDFCEAVVKKSEEEIKNYVQLD